MNINLLNFLRISSFTRLLINKIQILRGYFDNYLIRIVCRLSILINSPELLAKFSLHKANIITPAKSNGKSILALSHFRFRGDLDLLSSQGFVICYLDPLLFGCIQSYFYRRTSPVLRDHHNPEIFSESFYAKTKLNLFYKRFIKTFCINKKINILISAMAHYPQDMHLGAAAQEIGIPYVVLHRAGVIINDMSNEIVLQRYNSLGKFKGEKIIVQNPLIRDVLIKSGFCRHDQLKIIGSTRLNRLINKKDSVYRKFQSSKETLTLFSFTHSIGRSIINKASGDNSDWTNNSNEGLVQFFHKVHKEVIFFANNNPNINVIIKLKWHDQWYEKVESLVYQISGGKFPHNLKIFYGSDGTKFIDQSKVVIAFGSTVLIEAGFLGKHVIMPIFDEAADLKYRSYFPIFEAIDACYLAKKPIDIQNLALSLINTPCQAYGQNKKMKILYDKYLGPSSLDSNQLLFDYLHNI